MEKIIMPRGCGKTYQLIKRSAKTGAYIVCQQNSVDRIAKMAKEHGLNIPYPLSYSEFLNGKQAGRNINGFLIDEADALLQYLTNAPIDAITMSI